ncbi:uncharacterized protein NPIL_642471 [Nephila pilipes]|uniref:DNA repair protein XRCC4 n=1 Tax=Nephila pilipes TaxID=299642 RepID=A0A8X6P073_NEPPI|nr:uncharacterized protein NPIL_642471 [Nephila pilipes]
MTFHKALTKIRLQDQDDVFLVSEFEIGDKLVLKILNIKRSEIYIGQASDVELRSQAAKIRLTFNDYINKAIKALFGNLQSGTNFLYCLDKKDDKYTFKWKSIDLEETVINLGNVEMEKKEFVFVLTDILQSISSEMHMLNDKMRELELELNQSKNQTSETLKQLSFAIDIKESLEKEMYSKFVCVLNEKKRKIKQLQKKSYSCTNNKPEKKSRKSLEPVFSDTSDELDGLLDINKPGPSTTKEQKTLLFLDDNKAVIPTDRKRIRNRKIPISRKANMKDTLSSKNSSHDEEKIIEDSDKSDDSLLNYL